MTPKQQAAMRQALEALIANRRKHYYCEDTWYSCPRHEEGCANDAAGDKCNCGADQANIEIDKATIALQEALAEPVQEPRTIRMERVDRSSSQHWWSEAARIRMPSPELYAAGDAVLCWVNEGDMLRALPAPAAPQQAEAVQEPVAFSQFLTDVVTAAGLLSHGKTDKALARRISDFAFHLRTAPQPTKPAEPGQEPVAKVKLMTTGGNAGLATRIVEIDDHLRDRLRPGQLLYTASSQREWVGLTQEEVEDSYNADYMAQTRAIEAKLKEKNT